MNFLHDSTLFVIDTHQNMPFSLNLTPFDHFQMCPTFAVTPNLILEPCLASFHKTDHNQDEMKKKIIGNMINSRGANVIRIMKYFGLSSWYLYQLESHKVSTSGVLTQRHSDPRKKIHCRSNSRSCGSIPVSIPIPRGLIAGPLVTKWV